MHRPNLILSCLLSALWLATSAGPLLAGPNDIAGAATSFRRDVAPLLSKYCYDCHGDGTSKGKVSFDEFESDAAIVAKPQVWLAALKNVRAGLMPPREDGDEDARPTSSEIETLANWIKYQAFGINPKDPDPGQVTARRLNRIEYRNTIRDLMGIDFNSEAEFPPDDSGNGFDNNGDVLTLSPLLMEKYLSAAETIVTQAVPKVPRGIGPENHARFFPNGPAPTAAAARDEYARDVLRKFATRAYRRPVEERKVEQLLRLARGVYFDAGKSLEEGIGRAMMAVLGSPRFLFRIEEPAPKVPGESFPAVDEFSLASRLSYFLWSSMPDEELMNLAVRGELRRQLSGQVARMLKDTRSQAFVRQFTGQWLQASDVESVPINARLIYDSDFPGVLQSRSGRPDFDSAFRKLFRTETEMYFGYILDEDRSVLELVESDYTFLNGRIASFYGIPDVTGEKFRRVKLPPESVRGGVLTHGATLAVTSNPTRTSPVKRGLFILDNILGIPPPPAPPNVPDLEEAKKEFGGREPKLAEVLAVHRGNPLCKSCHDRMDPLGLALENFNALGGWREKEAGETIEPSGQLITGEKFSDVRDLKRVLVGERKLDIFRCLTEKLLTYALGRGLEYYDVHTVDQIVERLANENGRMSVLLMSVIESAAFQKQRAPVRNLPSVTLSPLRPSQSRP